MVACWHMRKWAAVPMHMCKKAVGAHMMVVAVLAHMHMHCQAPQVTCTNGATSSHAAVLLQVGGSYQLFPRPGGQHITAQYRAAEHRLGTPDIQPFIVLKLSQLVTVWKYNSNEQ